jgi:uncharacterized protein YdaU (DUF1376 family)
MATKRPYFPFYVNDFSADPVVEAMTAEQVGVYVLLLCKAWQLEPKGSIPDDDVALARWSRLTPKRWSIVKSGVLAAFRKQDGRYVQKRLTEEAKKLSDRSDSAAESAHRRWSCKRNANASNSHDVGICEPYAHAFDSDNGSVSFLRGGGVGAGDDSQAAELAGMWAFHCSRRDRFGQLADTPQNKLPEFREALRRGVSFDTMANEILRAGRDRNEHLWQFWKRLGESKPGQLDGIAEFVANGEQRK